MGEKAPDFVLAANDLSPRSLKDYAGKVLVLVCVPSLDTPVCDMEVRRFNTEAASLSDKVKIVAASCDLPFAQARWCGAAGVTAVESASDYKDVSLGRNYGVLIQELRLLARAVFVVDADNVVRYVEYVPEISSHPDYDALYAAVRKVVETRRCRAENLQGEREPAGGKAVGPTKGRGMDTDVFTLLK